MVNDKLNLENAEEIKVFLLSVKSDLESYNVAKPQIDKIINSKIIVDTEIMGILRNFFYYRTPQIGIDETLKQLKTIFLTNGYTSNDNKFFEDFDYEFSRSVDDQIVIWNVMKDCLLLGDKNNFFFGVWVFEKLFIPEYFCNKYTPDEIDVEGLKLIIQGILYYTFKPETKCLFALKASTLLSEKIPKDNLFFNVCVNELYDNYKHTFYEISTSYSGVRNDHTQFLIDEIIKKHERFLELQKEASLIPDLQPSLERHRAFIKAQYEYNQKINDMAKKQSVFFQVISNVTLKYGKKISHISNHPNEEMKYETQSPQKISHGIEIPHLMVNDPVNFYFSKLEFFSEREKYSAINT